MTVARSETSVPTEGVMTLAEQLPAHLRDRFEMVDGRLVEKVAHPGQGKMYERLFEVFRQVPRERLQRSWGGTRCFFRTPPHGIRKEYDPDLVAVHASNPDQLVDDEDYFGVPDLVLEILSRWTRDIDRGIKMETYAYHGVRHYWLAEPETDSIEAYRLEAGVYVRLWERPLSEIELPADLR